MVGHQSIYPNIHFGMFVLNLTPMYDQTQGSGVVFSLLITLLHFRAGGGGRERKESI